MANLFLGARPLQPVVQGAWNYQQLHGIGNINRTQFGNVVMPSAATQRIAEAYDRLPDFDRAALPAFRAMREETMRQYDHITKPRSRGGMGIDINVTRHDPYGAGPRGVHGIVDEIRDDILNHSRINVFSTAATGGHPFFSDDDNDAFRGVHDVFGHLGSGRGIDRHGEEAAFQKHAQMFTPLARAAMATETRGQNAALHAHGAFQDQKVALLPSAMRRLNFLQSAATAQDRLEAVAENRKQGLL